MMKNKNTGELTTYQNSGILNKIVNWSLAGNSRTDIIDLIRSHSLEHVTNTECDNLIRQSKQLLEQTVSVDVKQAVNVHVGYYENIYKYFHSILHTEGMNKSMSGKERLLGMTGQNKVVINRKTEINIRRQVEYDESKLSLLEKSRLDYLLDKMK